MYIKKKKNHAKFSEVQGSWVLSIFHERRLGEELKIKDSINFIIAFTQQYFYPTSTNLEIIVPLSTFSDLLSSNS